MPASHVFEVSAATFQKDVVERSRQTPILLDFWAEWCGPCKTLGPVLEKLAGAYGGAFLLGKVDSEREQDLAYAFQVQSIPFVVLLQNGRPVDAFAGALGEKEVRAFLTQCGVKPKQAEAAAPVVDPESPEASLALAKAALGKGDVAATRAALAKIPEDHDLASEKERLLEGLPWLELDLPRESSGAAGDLDAARRAWRAGQVDAALESILGAVAKDRGFHGGLPRKAMLLCFELLGPDDERADSFRKRLATALF